MKTKTCSLAHRFGFWLLTWRGTDYAGRSRGIALPFSARPPSGVTEGGQLALGRLVPARSVSRTERSLLLKRPTSDTGDPAGGFKKERRDGRFNNKNHRFDY